MFRKYGLQKIHLFQGGGGGVGSGDVVGRTGVLADRQTFLSAIATENHAKLQKNSTEG